MCNIKHRLIKWQSISKENNINTWNKQTTVHKQITSHMFPKTLLQSFDLSLTVFPADLHGFSEFLSGFLAELLTLTLCLGDNLNGLLSFFGKLFQPFLLNQLKE